MNIDPTHYGYVIDSVLYCPRCIDALDIDTVALQAKGKCYVLFSSDEPTFAGHTCDECDELIFDPHEDDGELWDDVLNDPALTAFPEHEPTEEEQTWLDQYREAGYQDDGVDYGIWDVALGRAIETVDAREEYYLGVWIGPISKLNF
jgi:hypothetical protein